MRWAVARGARSAAATGRPRRSPTTRSAGCRPSTPADGVISHGLRCAGASGTTTCLDRLGVTDAQIPWSSPWASGGHGARAPTRCWRGGPSTRCATRSSSGATQAGDVLVIFGATLIVWAVVDDWVEAPGLWTFPTPWPARCSSAGRATPARSSSTGPGHAARSRAPPARWKHGADAVPVESRRASGDPGTGAGVDPVPARRAGAVPRHDAAGGPARPRHDPRRRLPRARRLRGERLRRPAHARDRAGITARRIVASGGGTQVVPWMQAMADATGLPVDTVGVPEGSALGAAYMARLDRRPRDVARRGRAVGAGRATGRARPRVGAAATSATRASSPPALDEKSARPRG